MGAGTAAGVAMAGQAALGDASKPTTQSAPNYGSPADYGNDWRNVPGAETGGFTGQGGWSGPIGALGGATTGMGMGGGGVYGGGSVPFGGGGFGMMGGNVAGGGYGMMGGGNVAGSGYGMQGGGGQQQPWTPGHGQVTADQVVKQFGADPSVAQYWADKINTGGDPNYYIGRLKDDNAGTGPDAPGGLDSGKGSGSSSQQGGGMALPQLGGFGGSNMSFSPMRASMGAGPIRGYSGQPGGLGNYVQSMGGSLGSAPMSGGFGMPPPQYYGGTFAQYQPQSGSYGNLMGGVGQTGAGLGMFGLPQMQQQQGPNGKQ